MASSGPAYDRFLAKQDNLHSSVGTSLSATLTKNFGRFCKLYSSSGEEMASIPVGPKPRFLTASGGSVWTLNQGDGSVSRVDEKSRKVIATIPVGIPGAGGELAYGADALWATVFDLPLSRIDPQTNRVSRQWVGRGGDSLRFGHDSIWLTDYYRGLLWRIPAEGVLNH